MVWLSCSRDIVVSKNVFKLHKVKQGYLLTELEDLLGMCLEILRLN